MRLDESAVFVVKLRYSVASAAMTAAAKVIASNARRTARLHAASPDASDSPPPAEAILRNAALS